jgi:DNA invertase Pin-like site-specific DNA recombinase
VTALGGRGVGFKSLTEGVDTSTSNGRLVFHIFGSLADDAESVVMRSRVIDAQRAPA